jgi:hypothetical protein
MKVGDEVKLIKVHRFHPITLRFYFEKGMTGVVRGINRDGKICVRFGNALINFDVKPEYLEIISK